MKQDVAIYKRVSSEEQAKSGLSLEAQDRSLRDYCESKGWNIVKEYLDAGISGSSIKARPGFKQLLIDAKQKKFTVVLITKLDRAFRNVLNSLETLDMLGKLGIDFVSVTENLDTTTPMGKLIFTIISAFAELEREMTIQRVRAIRLDKFNRGIMTSRSPTGYKWSKTKGSMVIDPKESEMVKDIFKMKLEGIYYKEICSKHNLKPQSYYNIIKNKVYTGIVTFEGLERPGIHEALISLETYQKANSKK